MSKIALRYLRLLPVALQQKKLVELTYFITEKCNMNCDHCFNRLKRMDNPEPKLSLDEIDRFSKSLGPLLRLLLSGGEPFMHPDIESLCKIFIRNNSLLHLTIPTNGSLPKKTVQVVENLALTYPGTYIEIKISLDLLDEERDTFTHFSGGFNKVVDTVQRLRQLQSVYKNIGIGAITTCVPENQDQLNKICDFARNVLKLDSHSIGLARDFEGYRPDLDIKRFFKFYFKMYHQPNKKFRQRNLLRAFIGRLSLYRTYLDITYRIGEAEYIPCLSGSIRAVLDPYGNLYPCEIKGYPCSTSTGSAWLMGNIRNFQYNFELIRSSENALKVREKIKNTKCVCNHGCDMNTNILFSIALMVKVLFTSPQTLSRKVENLLDRL